MYYWGRRLSYLYWENDLGYNLKEGKIYNDLRTKLRTFKLGNPIKRKSEHTIKTE